MEKTARANVAFIGMVDSGKSTIIGHLLVKCGGISRREEIKIQQLATDMGKGSFKYAFLVDKQKIERERCLTINATNRIIRTPKSKLMLLNLPGHRDFQRNFKSGFATADIAVLCISAHEGQFERDWNQGFKELLLLVKVQGIQSLVVAVNKMDYAQYSEERYNIVKKSILKLVQQYGFKKKEISLIPVSGWAGDNLLEKSRNMPWWKGETLIDILENIQMKREGVEKPLRFPIQNVFRIAGVGTIVTGVVVSGTLKPGMMISITPGDLGSEVLSIEQEYQILEEAGPGDMVGIRVSLPAYKLKSGCILGGLEYEPPKLVQQFTARVVIVNCVNEIKRGYSPVIDCHTCHISCKFVELNAKTDKITKEELEEFPKSLKQGDHAIVTLVPSKLMCVETYKNFPRLGSFSIRDSGALVGVGIILSVDIKRAAGRLTKAVAR